MIFKSFKNFRMAMALIDRSNTSNKVHVSFAFNVGNINSFCLADYERHGSIVVSYILQVALDVLLVSGEGRELSAFLSRK